MLVLLQHVHEASTFQIFQQRGANIEVMWRCLSFEQKTCQMLAISMNIIGSKFMFHLPLSETLHTLHTLYTYGMRKNSALGCVISESFAAASQPPGKNPNSKGLLFQHGNLRPPDLVLFCLHKACFRFQGEGFSQFWTVFVWNTSSLKKNPKIQISSLRHSFWIGKLATFERLWISSCRGHPP